MTSLNRHTDIPADLSTHHVYIGMGANLTWRGFSPHDTLSIALGQLSLETDCTYQQHASLYQTSPVDAQGNDYINTVVHFTTHQTPHQLLHTLQRIEQQFDRTRPYHHAPRTLDLDLLLYDDCVINTPDLVIPHPRLTQRAFALIPLLEIAPNLNTKIIHENQTLQWFVEQIKHDATQQITRLDNLWYPQTRLHSINPVAN